MTADLRPQTRTTAPEQFPQCDFCGGAMVCEKPGTIVCELCRTDVLLDGARPDEVEA